MANFFDQFDEPSAAPAEAPAAPVKASTGGNFFDQFDEPVKDLPAAGMAGDEAAAWGRGIINGVPVVGPYMLGGVNRGVAAVRSLQNGTTFPEELKKVEEFGESTAKANPWSTFGGEMGGGVLGTLPLVAAAPVAFGAGAASLPVRMGASMASGGVLGAADAAVRSDGDADATAFGAKVGAGLGLAGPAIGAGVGKAVRSFTSKGRSQALVTEAIDGISDKDLASAQFMIEQAKSLPGGGVNLSLDEALNAVTGGQANRASQLARVVGNSGGEGGRIMGEFYAGRPASIDNVGRKAFDGIAPQNLEPTKLGATVQAAAQAGVAGTPEGQAVIRATQGMGPRVTQDQAGQVIQREMRAVADAREAARKTQADADYAVAKNVPDRVGIERTIEVERPGEPIVTQPAFSRPQFEAGAPRPAEAFERPSAIADDPNGISLARFIAQNGGLRLDGDAAATDLHRFMVPGVGKVARPDGKGLDNFWRERLIEEGYFRPDADGGMARDISSELLRKLQNEQRGIPSYPLDSAGRPKGRTAGAQAADEYANARSLAEGRFDEDLARVEIDPKGIHPDIRERVVGALMRGEETDPLTAYERTVGAMKGPLDPYVKSTTVTETIPDVRFGQVNPQAALDAIDAQMRSAKGDVRGALSQARKDLFGPGGDTDLTVEGLLHARERLDHAISAAREVGDATKVRDLQIARSTLDGELKAVPEVATADANFAANSRPLDAFKGETPLGRVVRQDPDTGRMATPAEQVPSNLHGATAAREFLANATPEARRAFQGREVTRILDQVGGGEGGVTASRLAAAMRENEDILAQLPEARSKLQGLAAAYRGRETVERSPLGKIASRPDVKNAVNALFPTNPLVGSQNEISTAVGSLARSNPRAARDTVRIYMEGVFNEATQDLKGIASQYGGAGFASAVRGNGQQRQNLEAAIRALPEGETVWTAMDRMLTVLEATGYRPTKGSDTYFNNVIGTRLREGNDPIGKAITDVVTGAVAGAGVGGPQGAVGGAALALKRSAKEIAQERRMLKDGEAIARILTDPKAMSLIRSLAKQPAGSKSAEMLTTKLIVLANRGVSSAATPSPAVSAR